MTIEVIDGIPLSGSDFIIKLTTEQVSLIAWGLLWYAQEGLHPASAMIRTAKDMSYEFAALSGDH